MRNILLIGWLSMAAIIATAGAAQLTNIILQAGSKFTRDNKITEIELEAHFVTTIRVPQLVNSVVVGDPALFQVEHSEHEPELVFVKALTGERGGEQLADLHHEGAPDQLSPGQPWSGTEVSHR